MFLQLTGVNSITYYASSIYESDLRFNATTSKILAAASQFAIVFGSCICSVSTLTLTSTALALTTPPQFTVDRFGRRSLMLFSAVAMSICFAFETGLVSNPHNQRALDGAVFFLFASHPHPAPSSPS